MKRVTAGTAGARHCDSPHRGIMVGDEIVFVGVTSAHRSSAFEAGQFIMDYLKTRAPFWKREATPEGDRWVEARESDQQAAKRW